MLTALIIFLPLVGLMIGLAEKEDYGFFAVLLSIPAVVYLVAYAIMGA